MTARILMPLLAAIAVTLAACGKDDAGSPMPGMTAAEHAMMSSGGMSGMTDSAGMTMRQAVHLTPAQAQALGVVYTTVGRETLTRTVRTVGTIQPSEDRVVDVTPKIDGFVERLFVNTTGASVRRGDPILSLYSPALVAAQEEYLTAKRLVAQLPVDAGEPLEAARSTLRAAGDRLRYWDIPEAQIARLEASGQATRTLALVAPVSGVVLVKDVIEGQRVMPGQRLYQVADLSVVWVEGEVFEQDLARVREGMQAHIEIAARPGEHLMGRVSFVYPTVDPTSRTARIRITMPNPGMQLKPGMFATIFLDAVVGRDVVVVPRSAVVVTGTRNLVFVRDSSGVLQPREVVLGARTADQVEVLSGLAAGEEIVGSANFLIDAESRLGGGGGTMPGMQHGAIDQPMPAGDTTGGHRHDP